MGVSFHFHTQKTPEPVTAPKADNVRWTGTKNARRCGDMVLWGCFKTCINVVSFDVAQDREPVERPFHDLWTNGLSLKRDTPDRWISAQYLDESERL